jgi:UDP-N-acetylglucosamine:LPS N-acetylglucosamine transferase
MRKERPDVVISTGAAPGLLGLILGRLFGAKAIWIDSVANSEKLSMSGKIAGYVADLWITQWSHLSSKSGPRHFGSVL